MGGANQIPGMDQSLLGLNSNMDLSMYLAML